MELINYILAQEVWDIGVVILKVKVKHLSFFTVVHANKEDITFDADKV